MEEWSSLFRRKVGWLKAHEMSDSSRPDGEVEVDLRAVFGAVGRRLPILILIALLVGAAVFAYLTTVEPRYRAEATLLIETSDADVTNALDEASTATLLDREGIASQVELIRSREVVLAVIEDLNLATTPEFDPAQAEPSLVDRVLSLVGLDQDTSSRPVEEVVLAEFRKHLTVASPAGTRVITISFDSTNPQLAADIVNAIADEYINVQQNERRSTAASATAWLQAEIDDLSERVVAAEAAVARFRADQDLFLAGRNANQADVTLSSQQLADLSTELARVQSQRAEAEANAELIRANLEGDAPMRSLEVLNSPLIQRLREQEVLLRADIAEASATLLPNHPRLRELNAQLADLESEIEAEARNVLAGLENEATLAAGYETELTQQIDQMKATVATSGQAEVQLRALERVAESERQLLDTYLSLARDAISRQNADSLPVNVRVISRAAAPIEAFSPKIVGMTAVAVIVTLMLGAAFLLVRVLASGRATRPVTRPQLPAVPDAVPVDGHVRWADDGDVRRMMPSSPTDRTALANRIEESLSDIARRLRQIDARRILITMAAPESEQGRPLAAVALARTLARTGAKVLLVDLHADDADQQAMGEADELPGFGDLFAGEASFAQVIFRDRSSSAHFIPRGAAAEFAKEQDRFDELCNALEQTYDHVIYDAGDSVVPLLGPSAGAAVVVTEVAPSDPRTVKAYEAVKDRSGAEILLLVTDPMPAETGRGAAA